jgi:MFS family permease
VQSRLGRVVSDYPRQFWVLFFGQLVSSSGTSLVWPFMTIYVHDRLGVPLTTVGFVLAANSVAGLVSQLAAGPAIDRLGRKIPMVVSLAMSATMLAAMGLADSLISFVALIALSGFFGAVFTPALNAMVADIIDSGRRVEAYGLIRIVANLGIAIGPAVGGFIATRSYLISFLAAALCQAVYFFVTLIFVKETKPETAANETESRVGNGGYGHVLRHYSFLLFCVSFTLMGVAYAQMMTIFPVYIKDLFNVPENQFGIIMATNAAMVVLFQWPITRALERYPLGPVLAAGATFTALGVGSVAFFNSFPTFLLSMVIVTVGELIFAPSSTAFVANVAPEAMRGRYMGVYGLTWGLSFGLGPVVGGLINDNLGPVYVWHIMLLVALVSAVAFLSLGRRAEVRNGGGWAVADADAVGDGVPSRADLPAASHDSCEVESR